MIETNNTPELDLSDEETLRRLMEVDVLKQPTVDEETLDIQTKLNKLKETTTFTFKLNGIQLEDVQRKAAAKGVSWKDYLTEEIQTVIFGAAVGKPVINRPSFVTGGRVGAPQGGLVTRG
jgi:predicted DNA binding CopG/RHH family protein